jgi:hypothetical protein
VGIRSHPSARGPAVAIAVLLAAAAGCGKGGGGAPDAGAPTDAPTTMTVDLPPGPCADIFGQEAVARYDVEIEQAVWTQLMADFALGPPLMGKPPYYPVARLSYAGEVRTDASIRLKGNKSWQLALEGPNPKAQFVIAFDQRGNEVPFHGVDKVGFDMYGYDPTMLNERVALAFMRAAGLPVGCASSAELYVNGENYGLFTTQETHGQKYLNRLFPGASSGVLLEAGQWPMVNESAQDPARIAALWAAHDVPAMRAAGVDLEGSLRAWAAEAVVNDADGYWAGDHNFMIYDHPKRGFLWLSVDLDSAFAWIGSMQHPIYWWAGRYWRPAEIPQHYLTVIADDDARAAFISALAAMVAAYDVPTLQRWVDDWSAQIAPAVARDTHRPFSIAAHDQAVAAMRDELAARATYLRAFLACAQGADGDDRDGDGHRWCDDCDDGRADVHPGATERCGDGVDQNCDSVADEGCGTK